MEKIYIIEDDENIRNLLKLAVAGFKYEPIVFENAEDALRLIETDRPSMAIFDVMLPGIDGIEAIKKVRKMESVKRIPIIILTAKEKETDKVLGLDGGADDYMVKPFGILELGARIRSLLRRYEELSGDKSSDEGLKDTAGQGGELKGSASGKKRVLSHGDIILDEGRHEVSVRGQKTELTRKEYKLLKYLMENVSMAVTREELLNAVWGYDYAGETRTVDMHIKALRQKLGDDEGSIIETIRGFGYKLV